MNHCLHRVLSSLALILLPFFQLVAQKRVDSPLLASITSNYWNDYLGLNPLTATGAGVHHYNDQLEITISRKYMKQSRHQKRSINDIDTRLLSCLLK